MRTRLSRAMRLLRLQDRMHQLAERDLAALDRRVQAADMAQADLIRALNEASAFHEPLRATAVGRLRRLAVEAQELRAERDISALRLMERSTQHKRTELWVGRLETAQRQHAEKRDWAERLDHLGLTTEASLRSAKPVNLQDEPRSPVGPADVSCLDGWARRDRNNPDTSTP